MTDPTIDPVPPAPEPVPAPLVQAPQLTEADLPLDPPAGGHDEASPVVAAPPQFLDGFDDPDAVEEHHNALAAWFLDHAHEWEAKVRTAMQTELEALHKYLTSLKDRLTSHL